MLAGNVSYAFMNEAQHQFDAYTTSLYWATATTTSTGYGDITAYNTLEKIFSVIAMIAGKLMQCSVLLIT